MKADDIALIARTMTPVVREFVSQQQDVLLKELALLEQRVIVAEQRAAAAEQRAMTPGPPGPVGPAGKDGGSSIQADLAALRSEVTSKSSKDETAQLATAVKLAAEATQTIALHVEQVKSALQALPVPQDGRSVTVDDVAPLVVAEVQKAVARFPVPQDGKDGIGLTGALIDREGQLVVTLSDGKSKAIGRVVGKDADVDQVQRLVVDEVAKIPRAKDGTPGVNGKDAVLPDIAAIVKSEVGQLPVPKDGRSVTVDEVAPLLIAEVHKAVAAIPPAAPPVQVTGAVIERDGILVLTHSDGSVKRIGQVVGKDGEDGRPGADVSPELIAQLVKSAVDEIPRPKDGRDGVDGIGFDDLSLVCDEQKGFSFRGVRGPVEKSWPVPVPYYVGIWRSGRPYVWGSTVTHKGALWIAIRDTTARPGEDDAASRDWKLCVKAGRDGNPGRDGKGGGS